MESFTLLKYWKPTQGTPQPTTLPQVTTAQEQEQDTDEIQITTDDEQEEEEEDEPYFDLHFTVPEDEDEELQEEEANESDSELRFTISPVTNDKLQLELHSSEPNSKPQFTASFLKSATKFRVFMLGLNKSKSSVQNPNQQQPESQKKKFFTVKFKVDEVPFVSFFTRDNSSKAKTANDNKASSKEKKQDNTEEESVQLHSPSSEDKMRFSKEVMQKYLKKVKPLYVRVSRKYAEKKLRFSGQLNTSPVKKPATEKVQTEVDTTKNGGNNVKGQKQGTLPLPAGLRVVCKRLGKSRSASSATPSPDATTVSSRRQDDSIVQQQDGIQSAILHCKSSFNASKECESSCEIE